MSFLRAGVTKSHRYEPLVNATYQEMAALYGVAIIPARVYKPRDNAHAERWVGSARRECLDWMLIVSQRHLEAVLGKYCAHYNDERPHRSCGLRPPAARGEPIRRPGATIRRRARLGGLLNEYPRAPIAA
jgi:putative transposase